MKFEELMNWEGYIYLEKLFEPQDNTLRMLINRTIIDDKCEDVEYLPTIQLDFETYVSYSVINECFDQIDKREKFKGRLFRIYTKSNYLDFIKSITFERDDLCPSEKYIHYQFPCLNHIIDVISSDKPAITVLKD